VHAAALACGVRAVTAPACGVRAVTAPALETLFKVPPKRATAAAVLAVGALAMQ